MQLSQRESPIRCFFGCGLPLDGFWVKILELCHFALNRRHCLGLLQFMIRIDILGAASTVFYLGASLDSSNIISGSLGLCY